MEFLTRLVSQSVQQVWLALLHNWPYLALSVLIAVALKLYVNAERVSAFLNRHRGAGVAAATVAAVGTPLCSCGTTAVVLGMMASTLPWAPIVAFMVASPLTSPEGLVYTAGIFGWPFSLAFFATSIVLGLAGGWIAAALESRGWLANQARFAEPRPLDFAASAPTSLSAGFVPMAGLVTAQTAGQDAACACSRPPPDSSAALHLSTPGAKLSARRFLLELSKDGRRLLIMFLGFAFVGYFLNGLIPSSWVAALFGGGNVYNVPLAATFGLPFYINSEASLPLVRAMLDNGMSQGAALAFLIAGAGTSIGAISGALTIARWRVVGLVVAILWVGAMLSGLLFDLWVGM